MMEAFSTDLSAYCALPLFWVLRELSGLVKQHHGDDKGRDWGRTNLLEGRGQHRGMALCEEIGRSQHKMQKVLNSQALQ